VRTFPVTVAASWPDPPPSLLASLPLEPALAVLGMTDDGDGGGGSADVSAAPPARRYFSTTS